MVGRGDAGSANWDSCTRSLHLRILLARTKARSVEQRARIAKAVIVPKVLFVARHCWSTTATIASIRHLIKSFIWGLASSPPWLPERQAELPISRGGPAIPDIESKLVTMSALAVGWWATNATAVKRLVDDIPQGRSGRSPLFVTPSRTAHKHAHIKPTMWLMGAAVLRRMSRDWVDDDNQATISARTTRFAAANRGSLCAGGSYSVDVRSAMSGATANELLESERRNGQFDPRWLERASTQDMSWLLDRSGRTYKLPESLSTEEADTVADVVK